MIAVPRWFAVGVASATAVYALVLALVEAPSRGSALDVPAILLFVAAFAVCTPGSGPLPPARAVVGAGVAVALPALALLGVSPTDQGPPVGSWFVPAVGCLALLMILRHRVVLGWAVLVAAALQSYVWDGVPGLTRYGLLAELLILAMLTAGAYAMGAAEQELQRYSTAQREAIQLRTAQEAYLEERETRLATINALAEKTLRRVADERLTLDDATRAECRVVHSSIRDETRGKRLLNDAVRAQVLAHRLRGATVQVNDDGGVDDLDPTRLEALLDQVAEALTGLASDRIIIRTSPADSPKAVTVVATSTDPIAAALGLEDDDEHVDLWLELDRTPGVLNTLTHS